MYSTPAAQMTTANIQSELNNVRRIMETTEDMGQWGRMFTREQELANELVDRAVGAKPHV